MWTLTFYAMLAEEGYATRDGVLPYGNSVRHRLNSMPEGAEAEPDAYNLKAVAAEPMMPTFSKN